MFLDKLKGLIEVAEAIAKFSKDEETKVGSLLISKETT